LYGLEEE